MRRPHAWEWVALVAVVLVGWAIIKPILQSAGPLSMKALALTNLKQTSTALMIYSSDADDRYPLRDVWMDALKPYTKDEAIFHCPLVPKSAYGYAFDSRLSGAKLPQNPASAVVLFESVNPIRNSSDPLLSLPNPGRHPDRSGEKRAGFNNFAFADSHAKAYQGGVVP